jgi:hypothetical protein
VSERNKYITGQDGAKRKGIKGKFPVKLLLKISSNLCDHSDGWRLAEIQMRVISVL